jgi:flagellar biosynthesis protein FlhF
MRLKTFTAKSLPDAMARVRERLGADAVILDQQTLENGDVRIVAALEQRGEGGGAFRGEGGLDAFNALSAAFDYHGLPIGLTDRLMAAAGSVDADTPQLALAGGLDAVFAFGAPPAGPTAKPLLLMGPPGAGKTATAAKLAALARVRGNPATLITMDLGKAGGLAQVQAFAEALGAELRQARDADSLAHAVGGCADDHLVIVDTLGASPYDADALRETRDWVAAAGADGVLVLPAGGDPLESAEVAITYAEAGARQLVATKLDATRRLGGLLSAAHAAKLNLMGVGVSAAIGGGLRGLNPMQMARLVLPAEPDDDTSPPPGADPAGDPGVDTAVDPHPGGARPPTGGGDATERAMADSGGRP